MWVRQRGPAGRDFSTQDSIIGAVLLKYWNISELQSFIVQMFLLRWSAKTINDKFRAQLKVYKSLESNQQRQTCLLYTTDG